jgi:crotonobetainyl-CoA:carnitine CoA-transferase CaiB-like acyl-CoA transferase
LAGVKIVDLSQVISGPLAGMWLADQGADVIKVEDQAGDPARWLGPRKDDMSALFFAVNRGKQGVTLDLKSDADKEALWALIESADVLLQNFRPGVAERLGFGYEAARARNARLIYCSISGFGEDGPRAKARAYDNVLQAVAGIAACQGATPDAPELVRSYICDKTTGLIAAQAITAALFARTRTGEGQHVSVNMLDSALAFQWPEGFWNHAFMDDAPAPAGEMAASYALWKTKDGHASLSALQQVEFEALTRALGRPELARDPRFASAQARMENRVAYRAELSAAVGALTGAELNARLAAEDAVGAAVNLRADVLREPQALHNGSFVEIDAGSLGRVRGARHPARFSATPVATPKAAPRLAKR